MIKKKYIYNPKTLTYEPLKPSFKTYLKQGGFILLLSLSLAFIFSFSYSYFFDTIEEAQLKQQNTKLYIQLTDINQEVDSIHSCLNMVQEKDDELYRILLGESPLANEIRIAGIGGSSNYFTRKDVFQLSQINIDKAKARLSVQNSSLDELTYKALKLADEMNSQPRISPIRESQLIRFASRFGYREHPIFKIRKFHKGVDLTASTGTPVYATAPGKVVIATDAHDGYGNKIVIDHGNGYKTVYAHLSKINVKYGSNVNLATQIGEVGNTGRSISAHLHYEVRINGFPVNPADYFYRDFSDSEFDQLIELALR